MIRPVYLSRAGAWCAAGATPARIRERLARRETPPGRCQLLQETWPFGYAADPARPCLERLEEGLDFAGAGLDLCGLPAGTPLLVGTSSFLIGATEARGEDFGALAPVEELQNRIQRRWGLHGPARTFSCACASAVHALEAAVGLIGGGFLEEVLVAGVELANRTTLAGFASLQLLSPSGCRPLDAGRDGLVLGEAVAVVRLRAKPAPWRVHAPALLLDPTSATGHDPDGGTIASVMRRALAQAGLEPGGVGTVKVQAAGSRGADAAEARGLRLVFGAAVPPVFSLKAALGHTLGACGIAEMVAALHCWEEGWLPPTAGFGQPDPELGLVPIVAPERNAAGPLLLNIQGFGGCLASWVVERA